MQLLISAEQVEMARKWVEPLILPLLVWGYKKLKEKINLLVTENVNRIRDELKNHVDDKISEHEKVEMRFFSEMKRDFDQKHQENKETLKVLSVQK